MKYMMEKMKGNIAAAELYLTESATKLQSQVQLKLDQEVAKI